MSYIYEAFAFLSGVLSSIFDFILYIPYFILDIFAYLFYLGIKIYLFTASLFVELSYRVVRMLFENYEVYELLNSAFNMLPPNLRAASHEFGIVEGVRIVIDALGASFVLRAMGW